MDKQTTFFIAARASPFDALNKLRRGDYNGARLALQKIAQIAHKDHPEQLPEVTRLVSLFAQIDPLYLRGIRRAQKVIQQRPGVKQVELYEPMGLSPEDGRYVLFFAEVLGQVTRVKKGNTYLVYVEPEAVAETQMEDVT